MATAALAALAAFSGGDDVVTDLNGNVFQGGNRLTLVVRSETNLTYNAFGPPVVNLTLSLPAPGNLVGLYGVTSVGFPPTIDSVALQLSPE